MLLWVKLRNTTVFNIIVDMTAFRLISSTIMLQQFYTLVSFHAFIKSKCCQRHHLAVS